MHAEAIIENVSSRPRPVEVAVWIIVLAMLNAPLFTGGSTAALALLPGAVRAGEWWRVFSHPFVHVSWYSSACAPRPCSRR
jgi:membrane associated rhomboid family serine protease